MVQLDMNRRRGWSEGKAGRGEFPEMKGYANTDRDTDTHVNTPTHTHTLTQWVRVHWVPLARQISRLYVITQLGYCATP